MDFNVSIIGAGVVGLAIAAKISSKFSNVLILEKHNKFGQETSSRNSEVIHSGVYYPSDSLKSKLCIAGKELLYDYCLQKNINHKKCGKLIIASNNEEKLSLNTIYNQAKMNGVNDCRLIEKDEILQLEPNIHALSAILFPSTGIIDSHGLMKQLETDCNINNVQFAYGNQVIGVKKIDEGYCIKVADDAEGSYEFTTRILINAGGLSAFDISSLINLNNPEYKLYFWKGEYFTIGNGKHKYINSLIYPVPNKNITGLGVHATIDLNNRVKLGPNAIFLDENKLDYFIDIKNKKSFYESALKFLPFIELEDLFPDQAGIRPKLQKPGDAFRDFIIKNESVQNYPNFINLLGIESPGLTSCLSIADYVNELIINN